MTTIVDSTFVHWATERESVRRRRAAGLPREDWTVDPYLTKYRYCNVSREDDRTTIWIKENVRDPYDADGDERNLFLATALSRFINLPESLKVLVKEGILVAGKPLNLHRVSDCLRAHGEAATKNRVFAAAYMVGAPDNYRTYQFGYDKVAYVCGVLSTAEPPKARTRKGYVEELSKQFGFAEFMAGQIAADMQYTRILQDAPDHMTWAPRGPGAMRGMNMALGKPIERVIPRDEYIEVGKLQMSMLPKELVEGRRLTLHDVASNVNCETFKYIRVRSGGSGGRKFY